MKAGITLTSRARIKEDILFRDLEGEIVLLNLRTGVYFGLDPVGTRISHLLQEHQSLWKVLHSLVEEYEVKEGQCEQDLLGFVAGLREHELVEVDNGAVE